MAVLVSNAHSSSPVSDGFRLDGRLAHDVIGRSSPMAPLGCDARLRFPAGHHRFYYRPLMRRRPSQCRTSLLSCIFCFYPVQFSNWLIDSLSSSLADWEIRAPLLWFLATLPRPAPPKISSSNRGMDRTGHRPQTTVRHLGQYGQCGQSYGFHHRIAKPSHAGNFVF